MGSSELCGEALIHHSGRTARLLRKSLGKAEGKGPARAARLILGCP